VLGIGMLLTRAADFVPCIVPSAIVASWIDSDRLTLVGAHRPVLQHRDGDCGADMVGR